MDKEEDGEFSGVSSQKRGKLKAEELHQAKWDSRHEEKEAADLKRSIKKELKKQTTVEQKEDGNEEKT
eukprot:10136174-Heterocapsa_arctica.AAC.1